MRQVQYPEDEEEEEEEEEEMVLLLFGPPAAAEKEEAEEEEALGVDREEEAADCPVCERPRLRPMVL